MEIGMQRERLRGMAMIGREQYVVARSIAEHTGELDTPCRLGRPASESQRIERPELNPGCPTLCSSMRIGWTDSIT